MSRNPLISFELTKIYKSKLLYLLAILLLILIGIIYWFTYSNFSTYKNQTLTSLSFHIESFEDSIRDLEGIPEAESLREILTERKEIAQHQINAISTSNWEEFTELQIQTDRILINLIESENAYTYLPISEVKKQVALNEEILKRGVTIVPPGTETEGISFMSNIIKLYFNFVGIFIFILIICNFFAQEIESGTFKFVLNQPIHYKKVIYTKYLLSIFIGILLTLLVLGTSFFIGTILNGSGQFNYPVLVTTGEENYQFISILEFIIKSTILYMIGLVFICSLVFLITIITKSSLITFVVLIILVLLGVILYPDINLLLKFAHFNPFLYLDSSNIINMSISEKLNNYNFSLWKGIILLSVSSFVMNFITLKLMKKKFF